MRLDDGEKGLSARTIRRRLATLPGLYGYLGARGLIAANPVPTGLSIRKPADHRHLDQMHPADPYTTHTAQNPGRQRRHRSSRRPAHSPRPGHRHPGDAPRRTAPL